jgi:hypothetical protein
VNSRNYRDGTTVTVTAKLDGASDTATIRIE